MEEKIRQLQDVIKGHEEESVFLKLELQITQEKIEALQEIKVRLQQQEQRNNDVAEGIKAYEAFAR